MFNAILQKVITGTVYPLTDTLNSLRIFVVIVVLCFYIIWTIVLSPIKLEKNSRTVGLYLYVLCILKSKVIIFNVRDNAVYLNRLI